MKLKGKKSGWFTIILGSLVIIWIGLIIFTEVDSRYRIYDRFFDKQEYDDWKTLKDSPIIQIPLSDEGMILYGFGEVDVISFHISNKTYKNITIFSENETLIDEVISYLAIEDYPYHNLSIYVYEANSCFGYSYNDIFISLDLCDQNITFRKMFIPKESWLAFLLYS